MTRMLRLLVVHAVVGLLVSANFTKCEVGKEDLVGTSKYLTAQVCNLFGTTCYMNHVSLTKGECATKALKVPHGSCALFPIISYKDYDNSDPANLLVGTLYCSISCKSDGKDCKFQGSCVSVQCSLGGNSWAGTAVASTAASCTPIGAYKRTCPRTAVTDASKSSNFKEISIMSLTSASRTVFLSRTGNFVAATGASRHGTRANRDADKSKGSQVGLVGMFPTPTGSTTQSGPAKCPSENKLMKDITETADQLRTCTTGSSGGKKYMYAGAVNLFADSADLNGYGPSRRRVNRYEAIDGNVLHGNYDRRRTAIPFLGGVLQRYTDQRSTIKPEHSKWPTCFQFQLRKGIDGPTNTWSKSSVLMESEYLVPNSLFSGEVAGTYRNYVAVFYCTDYARKNLTKCAADKGAVFYVADPSPALHFGKTAESIATKKSAACVAEATTIVATTTLAPTSTTTLAPTSTTTIAPKKSGATSAPTSAPTSGPASGATAAPTTVTTTSLKSIVVTLKLTVKNLDYQKLLGNATLKAAVIAAFKKVIVAIAAKAGVTLLAKHITLVLSSGSVVVDATIDTAAAGVDQGTLKASLTSAKSAVESDVLAEVKNIPGIASIKANASIAFAVASETAPTTTAAATTKPGAASSSIALKCSSGFVFGIFLAVSAACSEL